MSLVLALEPDPKQAAILRQVVRDRVGADLVLADSKDGAIAAIAERVPDLILVTALLSPRDEADLTDHLRNLDGTEHLQTLTIPLLASGAVEAPKPKKRGLLSALTGESPKAAAPIGCDPRVFAEEVRNYLVKAEDAKAGAATERSRFAKRAAGAGRKRDASGTTPAARVSARSVVESLRIPQPETPPIVEEGADTKSGSYWAWDSPTPEEATAAAKPRSSPAPESGDASPLATEAAAKDGPAGSLPPPPHPTVGHSSSWANPWDVSKTPEVAQPAPADPVAAAPERDPLVYLDDHQLPADALVPSAQGEAVEQLLGQPATLSPAEMVAVAPLAPLASDDEIDLSSLLDGAPTLTIESEAEPEPQSSSDVFTLTKGFDLSALIAQALNTPAARTASTDRPHDAVEADATPHVDTQALLEMKADVDRLRADREEVERALAEARAAQGRAEQAAAEASAKAQEDVERQTREVTARAEKVAAAERREREQQERELREEAERRLEVERLARGEAERLTREVEVRMREEAEAERRLRAEAERQVAEAEAARVREAAERLQHEQAERQAREQAEQQAGLERRAREQAEARADAERLAREAAEQKSKQDAARLALEAEERTSLERRGREQAEARAEAERQAREQVEQRMKDEAARMAREAEQRAEAERLAREQAEVRAENERLAREAAEKKNKEETERLAREADEQRRAREAERKSREDAERRAAIEAEARAAAEQRAREDFERRDREIAEQVARETAQRQAQQEAERQAREQAEQAARADADRRVAEERKARQEAERLARREADRRAEAERRAKEEAARLAAEAATKAREEARAERKARELAERRAAEERKARELAERKAREEATRRAAAELRAKKEAEERDRERDRRATAKKPIVIKKAKRRPAPEAVVRSRQKDPRPAQDEWGLYDPDKCGFGALFAKLEEIEDGVQPDDERSAADDLIDEDGVDYGAPATERAPRPLSMWAWRATEDRDSARPSSPVGPDDFRALVDRLSIPAAVAAVRYASGARIGRVKITRRRRRVRAANGDAKVIILSRKLLVAARQESAPTGRLTARR